MSNYFDNFPVIEYNGVKVRDITRRNNIVNSNLKNPYLFLPYVVKDGEKPEDIAHYYYGSVDYTWLVLYCNNMMDPYKDWPLSSENFNEYLIDKYKQISGKSGSQVIDWTANETIRDNILYYYKEI